MTTVRVCRSTDCRACCTFSCSPTQWHVFVAYTVQALQDRRPTSTPSTVRRRLFLAARRDTANCGADTVSCTPRTTDARSFRTSVSWMGKDNNIRVFVIVDMTLNSCEPLNVSEHVISSRFDNLAIKVA